MENLTLSRISYKIKRRERVKKKHGWVEYGYDKHNRPIFFRDYDGYYEYILLDEKAEVLYFENNLGYIKDNRYTSEQLQKKKEKQNRINERKAIQKEKYDLLRKAGFSSAEAATIKYLGKKLFKKALQEKAKEKITGTESLVLKTLRGNLK